MAAAPESDSSPVVSPLMVLAVVPVSVTHLRSMTSRLLPAIRADRPGAGAPEVRP